MSCQEGFAAPKVNNHIAGVWRSDAGEWLNISANGPVMGSVNKFTGNIEQLDNEVVIWSINADRQIYKCVYRLMPNRIRNVLDLPQ